MAATTPALALIRSLATPAAFSIVPLALTRLRTTRTATTTRPSVMERSVATLPTATRPLVLVRSLSTPPALATWLSVLTRLIKNTTGSRNTANGARALLHNITGDDNTANGYQ